MIDRFIHAVAFVASIKNGLFDLVIEYFWRAQVINPISQTKDLKEHSNIHLHMSSTVVCLFF